MKRVCILGSTGSVGVNTLRVLAVHPEPYLAGLEAEGHQLFNDLGDGRDSCVSCHQVFEGEGEILLTR